MIRYNHSKWSFATALLTAVMLVGCAKDPISDTGNPAEAKIIHTTFTLSPEFVEEITVRDVAGVDEKLIQDLWVVQLNNADNAQLKATYISDASTLAPSSNGNYKVAVPLVGEESKVYFIANTHDPTAYTVDMKTSALVEAVAKQVANESSIATGGIPMAGVWSGKPDLIGISERVSLSRAVAKVNFTLNANLPKGEVFQLQSVKVKQVPNSLNYFRGNAVAIPYPTLSGTIEYAATTFANSVLNETPVTFWWYMPENARGIGTATIQTEKGTKFPANQAAYCTYIEVQGIYEAAVGTYSTIYKIYLGANNTNDYNVKRNTVYDVNTTLMGIDAIDTRINSTDISIIIGLFGGWDDTKKEYTKLLEVQCVETAKDPALQWSKDQTLTGATNIHYGPTNIIILSGLSSDLSNYPAVKYCADLGNGWYLPSQNQLMAIWAAYNGIPKGYKFKNGNYWSATEGDASASFYLNPVDNDGNVKNDSKISFKGVRCVRDIMPYSEISQIVTTDGKAIIDNRSMPALVLVTSKVQNTTATNTTALTDNNISDIASAASNATVSQYFEVMKTDLNVSGSNWLDAVNGCENYQSGDNNNTWRLPTQRELYLIWTLNSTLKAKVSDFVAFSKVNYWSATESDALGGWAVSFKNGASSGLQKTYSGSNYQVRCVRDLTPPAN